jgi:hypothetical protein
MATCDRRRHVDLSRGLWYHLSVVTHQLRWPRDEITREDPLRDLSRKLGEGKEVLRRTDMCRSMQEKVSLQSDNVEPSEPYNPMNHTKER